MREIVRMQITRNEAYAPLQYGGARYSQSSMSSTKVINFSHFKWDDNYDFGKNLSIVSVSLAELLWNERFYW